MIICREKPEYQKKTVSVIYWQLIKYRQTVKITGIKVTSTLQVVKSSDKWQMSLKRTTISWEDFLMLDTVFPRYNNIRSKRSFT